MKILLVSTYETKGGAAVACKRLFVALQKTGVDVSLLVLYKDTDHKNVVSIKKNIFNKARFIWERLCIFVNNHFNRKKLFEVSIANTGYDIGKLPLFQEADILHLHWINQGMLSTKSLESIKQSGKPMVWTLHDMWPLTGICHYSHTCQGFTRQCGQCPFLDSRSKSDLSNKIFQRKLRIYDHWAFEVVTVSTWLKKHVESSTLLKDKSVTVIPNTLSLKNFHTGDKQKCRQELNLPSDKKILVFGAAKIDSPIKGFHYLCEALQILNQRMDTTNIHLVLFGQIKSGEDYLKALPVSHTWLGHIQDKTLATLYIAADALIAPSLYETFGQTLIEAQACGCVPVCFNNSGQTDIISHQETGYLAEYLSVESLRDGIYWALNDIDHRLFAQKAMEHVSNNYTEKVVAEKYLRVYQRALE